MGMMEMVGATEGEYVGGVEGKFGGLIHCPSAAVGWTHWLYSAPLQVEPGSQHTEEESVQCPKLATQVPVLRYWLESATHCEKYAFVGSLHLLPGTQSLSLLQYPEF